MSDNEKKPITREEIVKKTQSDKKFRKALIDNPKGTLGQLGVQIPKDVEVKVVEESAKVVYLVLPVNPDELTDEQLSNVVGAGCGVVNCADANNYSCVRYSCDCLGSPTGNFCNQCGRYVWGFIGC